MHQIGSGMYVSGPTPDRRRERRLSAYTAAYSDLPPLAAYSAARAPSAAACLRHGLAAGSRRVLGVPGHDLPRRQDQALGGGQHDEAHHLVLLRIHRLAPRQQLQQLLERHGWISRGVRACADDLLALEA